MSVVIAISAAILAAAALLVLLALLRSPSMLGVTVALDVLLAIAIAGVGLEAVASGNPTAVPSLVVLALLGFVGSVGVARFLSRRNR